MRNRIELSSVADIIMGQSPDSSFCNSLRKGMPFLQGCGEFGDKYPEIENYCTVPKKISPKGSILISVRAPVGDLNLADDDYVIGRGLAGIVANGIDMRFLFYSIDQFKYQLVRLSQGSTFEAINSADLRQFWLLEFEESEQKKIAHVLSTCDAVIEQTKAVITKYQAIKQGLMHDLFTRGIDLNTGQLRPTYEEAPELYKESELGMIPKQWRCQSLGGCIELHNNLRKPISALERAKMVGSYPYYGATGIVDRISDFSVEGEFVLIGEDGDHFLKWAKKEQTILVNGKFNVSNHAHIMEGVKYCSSEWIHHYFMHRDITYYLTRQGAGRFKLNKMTLLSLPILFPNSRDEQDQIAKKIKTLSSNIEVQQLQLSKLQNIKAGLMQDLLTGKKEVTVTEN